MREIRHPITMFVVAVLVVIGIGVGVLAGTTTPSHLARPVVAPALFSSLARSGIEGTFSAVYKLSAPTSSAESDATVTVARRANLRHDCLAGWQAGGVVVSTYLRRWFERGVACARQQGGGLLAGSQVEVAV